MQNDTASLMSPFMSPEFAIAVDCVRADTRVAILTDGSQIVGFFPFQRRSPGLGSPVGSGINNWEGLVHVPGFECDARELLKGCQLSVWHFDHLPDGQHPFGRFAASTSPSPVIGLSRGFPEYYEQLRTRSPKLCQTLGRKRRRMEEALGEVHLAVGCKDLSALRTLMAWKTDQCRRNNWSSPLDRPWVADVFEYLLNADSANFQSILSVMYAGDSPVSAHFDLRTGNTLAIWLLAYETSFSKWSPGMLHNIQLVEDAALRGVTEVNFGRGTEQYKELLSTDTLTVARGIAFRQPLFKRSEAALSWAQRHRHLLPGGRTALRYRRRVEG